MWSCDRGFSGIGCGDMAPRKLAAPQRDQTPASAVTRAESEARFFGFAAFMPSAAYQYIACVVRSAQAMIHVHTQPQTVSEYDTRSVSCNSGTPARTLSTRQEYSAVRRQLQYARCRVHCKTQEIVRACGQICPPRSFFRGLTGPPE